MIDGEASPMKLEHAGLSEHGVQATSVSVIMPIRNEADFIERSLGAVVAQDYPPSLIEVLIADGMSDDETRTIIARLAGEHPEIRIEVIDNPRKIVPTGFNLALGKARGDVVVRVDGHTIIAPDYVRECVAALRRTGADNVGGRMRAVGETSFAKAVSLATSSRFGVGGARFHYLHREAWADTVYMGAWPRAVFEGIGRFDEEQVRNQDDEFNYRLRERNGKILLSPRIASCYFTRSSPRALWSQYYQYGYWKVRVMQKHPRQMRPHQFLPAIFVGVLLASLTLAPFFSIARWALLLAVGSYLLANASASALVARGAGSAWRLAPLLPLVFAILHLSYGAGFLVGLVEFRDRWSKARATPSSRGGAEQRSAVRVLMVTSEWPTPETPFCVPFLVQQVDFLRRAGADVEIFFFRGSKNPINYLKAWWRFNRTYKCRGQFDVVHAQFGQAALIPWPKRWPLIVTFHGTDLLGQLSPDGRMTWQGRLLIWLGRNVARLADAVLIVSGQMKRNLPADMPVRIHPTGVDLEALPHLTRDEARTELGLSSEERLALFVGSPANPLKRYRLALQAIEELSTRLPTRLVLGWGMPHRHIITMMLACDVLVVTSAQEGSPTIFKEALACDLPIVSVEVGDAVERFGNVEGCEIVPGNEAGTIAAAVERVLRRGARIKGREAVEPLDERRMAQELIGIYRSVLTRAGRSVVPAPASDGDHRLGTGDDRNKA